MDWRPLAGPVLEIALPASATSTAVICIGYRASRPGRILPEPMQLFGVGFIG